jgi:hypothetical protein
VSPSRSGMRADIARVSFECDSYANGVEYAEFGEPACPMEGLSARYTKITRAALLACPYPSLPEIVVIAKRLRVSSLESMSAPM